MRVCQERSDQKVGSESLYSGVLFQVLVLIHYNTSTQKPISVFLCDICAHSLTVKSEGEYKILNGIFPLSNMTYLPEEILQFKLAINIKVWFISQLPGLLHTQDSSLCSQKLFQNSKLSRKSGILFYTHTERFYHIHLSSVDGLQSAFGQPGLQIAHDDICKQTATQN